MTEHWQVAAFLLLDKRFRNYRHLHATRNPGGDYDLRCSKCGGVETYSGAGDEAVDALRFASYVAEKHSHAN